MGKVLEQFHIRQALENALVGDLARAELMRLAAQNLLDFKTMDIQKFDEELCAARKAHTLSPTKRQRFLSSISALALIMFDQEFYEFGLRTRQQNNLAENPVSTEEHNEALVAVAKAFDLLKTSNAGCRHDQDRLVVLKHLDAFHHADLFPFSAATTRDVFSLLEIAKWVDLAIEYDAQNREGRVAAVPTSRFKDVWHSIDGDAELRTEGLEELRTRSNEKNGPSSPPSVNSNVVSLPQSPWPDAPEQGVKSVKGLNNV